MAKGKKTNFNWSFGIILLVVGVFITATTVVTTSLGQGISNHDLNVNLVDSPPTFRTSEQELFQTPEGSSESPLTGFLIGDGPTITGVVGGNTSIRMRTNVEDVNGYAFHPNFTVRAKIRRSGVASSCTDPETACLPGNGVEFVTCEDEVVSPTVRTWECVIDWYFFSDPTDTGTAVDGVTDFSAENWVVDWQADEDNSPGGEVDDTAAAGFETPNILGISIPPALPFGSISTDGNPGALLSFGIPNLGNQLQDIRLQGNQANDADFWDCDGGGNLLISDLHFDKPPGSLYATMDPLTDNGSFTTYDGTAGCGGTCPNWDSTRKVETGASVNPNISWRVATDEPVGTGACRGTSILIEAITGF